MFFYRRLWKEAETDRRAAEADRRVAYGHTVEMAARTRDLLDALGIDDHPDVETRIAARQLRRAISSAEKQIAKAEKRVAA